MKLRNDQYGAGLWTVVFILFLIGFVTFTGLKLFPLYMEDFSIQSSLESMEADTVKEYRGAMNVRGAVLRRFGINNVDMQRIGRDAVSVTREGGMYKIDVSYEVVVPYIGNVSLLVDFQHTAFVRAGV